MSDDSTSVTAALFGLEGFEVLAAADAGGEQLSRPVDEDRLGGFGLG
jgi:hypothetical protein